MLNSIKKYSKTFFFKVLVGIIILPFLFWGMGDVFSGGSQNVVAKVDSEKISARDFINYIRVLNLSDQERESISKSNLIERILSDYIGKRVLILELEDLNVSISDKTLKEIIINDKIFFKDNKFSRTEYEKFLITNSLTAPLFEKNIAEQEKKRQLLSYLSEGIEVPNFLVQFEFNKENQTKELDYINLKNFYDFTVSKERFDEIYKQNKDFFSTTYKNFKIAELTPTIITGSAEFDKNFFNKINQIENKTLDNSSFDTLVEEFSLKTKTTGLIDATNKKLDGKKFTELSEVILKSLFNLKEQESAQFLNIENKYYIAELTEVSNKTKKKEDKEVEESIKAQITIEKKISANSKIAKEINEKKMTRAQMNIFAEKNNLEVKSITVKSLKENSVFSPGVIKRIFETNDGSINLITDNMLKDNFIIYTRKTNLPKLKVNDSNFDQYKLKAKLNLANEIYNIFDLSLNKKYKVEINNKTLNRIKNSF